MRTTAAGFLTLLLGATTADIAASDPAPAASGATDTLEEVIVTGEKTRRSLDATAASVRVLSGRDLEDSIFSSKDVLDRIANITSSGAQNLAPAVRGVDGTGPAQGSDAFFAGTRPRLNVQIDGRTASYNEAIFGDLGLWDVSRVEVFRGAQSTLQGRNALAGTIIYTTNDPTFEPEMRARVLVGDRAQREYAAVVSAPLVDEVAAFRVAIDHQTRDSFVKGFDSYARVDDPGEFELTNARAKLLLTPDILTDFRTLLTVAHTDYSGPQTEVVGRPFDDLRTNYAPMPVFAPRITSAVVDTSFRLSDRFTFENRLTAGDVFVARKAAPGDGNVEIDGRDFAIEPRVRFGSQDDAFAGFFGLYAFRARQDDSIDIGDGSWRDETETYAVYGEATLALQPALDLTFGGRYEEERRERTGSLAIFVTDFDETYRTFLPKVSLAWRAAERTTLGVAVSRGYNGGGAAFTYDEPFTNYTFDPEYVWNLESFARTRLLDNTLRLTANVFYSDYQDMQTPFDLNPDPNIWAYVVRNAPRAETYGAELGASWAPLRELTLDAEVGLLETRIRRYPDSGVEGHELPRAPAMTATLAANWSPADQVELGASARYSSAYYSDVTNVPRGRVSPGWIANVRAAWSLGSVRVFGYVDNVFDSTRPILIEADPNALSAANDAAMLPRPRTMGFGVEVSF